MKKALIVGLNNYPTCPLSWCDDDAIAVKGLIESNGDGSPNFDVKSIIDSCSKSTLRSAIEELFEGDSDISLLYFSGHGADTDGGYLCTTDFSSGDYGVRMSDVLNWANNSKCKNKVIILDCCFAGKMGESLLVNNDSILGEGVTIIAASQSWQISAENGTIHHGVFTDLLIQGLKGGAADISGSITPASLYSFIDQSLGAWQQRPCAAQPRLPQAQRRGGLHALPSLRVEGRIGREHRGHRVQRDRRQRLRRHSGRQRQRSGRGRIRRGHRLRCGLPDGAHIAHAVEPHPDVRRI